MDKWNKERIAGMIAIIASLALAVIPLSTISDFYDNIAVGKGLMDLIGPSLAGAQELNQDELESVMGRILAEEFEKDKAEAIARGISIEVVIKERIAKEKAQRKVEEAEEEREEKKDAALRTAVFGIIVFAVVTMLYRFRRKIAANLSPRWRRQSKAFRTWAFAGVCWLIGVFLFVFLMEPYGNGGLSDMEPSDFLHMLGVMLIPPLFFGGAWFGYKRFVE